MANNQEISLVDLVERVTDPSYEGEQDMVLLQMEIVDRIKLRFYE